MDTKNLDNLIQDYAQLANKTAALETEHEVMREALQQIAGMNEGYSRIADAIKLAKAGLKSLQVPNVAIAPQPKFVKGDKVRVKATVQVLPYPDGEFDTVYSVNQHGGMCLSFWEDGGISDAVYNADDLEPYNPD